jgi:hypothetical protein
MTASFHAAFDRTIAEPYDDANAALLVDDKYAVGNPTVRRRPD